MIEINNLTTVQIDEEFLKKIAQKVLEGESAICQLAERKEESNLSIALVGQGRIRELNKRYRGKNRVTDVLAFPNKDYNPPTTSSQPSVGPLGLGEIVICLREVKKNAKKFSVVEETKVSSSPSLNSVRSVFEKELVRVLIHGILHLLGYDHEKGEAQAKKMEGKQNYYLKLFFK